MNTPNKLSTLRLFMAIAAVVVFGTMIFENYDNHTGWVILVAIFSTAAFTDYLDGSIARKTNSITTFGKFIDPIADKILVNSMLIMITVTAYHLGTVYPEKFEMLKYFWVITVVMIIRDIAVDASRMMCAKEGKVVAASIWGKIKTILQMFGLVMMLVGIAMCSKDGFADECKNGEVLIKVGFFTMAAAAKASVVGGAKYLHGAKDIILKTK